MKNSIIKHPKIRSKKHRISETKQKFGAASEVRQIDPTTVQTEIIQVVERERKINPTFISEYVNTVDEKKRMKKDDAALWLEKNAPENIKYRRNRNRKKNSEKYKRYIAKYKK